MHKFCACPAPSREITVVNYKSDMFAIGHKLRHWLEASKTAYSILFVGHHMSIQILEYSQDEVRFSVVFSSVEDTFERGGGDLRSGYFERTLRWESSGHQAVLIQDLTIISDDFRSQLSPRDSLSQGRLSFEADQGFLSLICTDTPSKIYAKAGGIAKKLSWGSYVWSTCLDFADKATLEKLKEEYNKKIVGELWSSLKMSIKMAYPTGPSLPSSWAEFEDQFNGVEPYAMVINQIRSSPFGWKTPKDVRETHIFHPDGKTEWTFNLKHKADSAQNCSLGKAVLLLSEWQGAKVVNPLEYKWPEPVKLSESRRSEKSQNKPVLHCTVLSDSDDDGPEIPEIPSET